MLGLDIRSAQVKPCQASMPQFRSVFPGAAAGAGPLEESAGCTVTALQRSSELPRTRKSSQP